MEKGQFRFGVPVFRRNLRKAGIMPSYPKQKDTKTKKKVPRSSDFGTFLELLAGFELATVPTEPRLRGNPPTSRSKCASRKADEAASYAENRKNPS
jgi:hypothetical protein